MLLGTVAVPSTVASAASCLPAGGVDDDPPITEVQYDGAPYDRTIAKGSDDPYAEAAHDVIFSGGGWGHGIGLSQYAAQGAAATYGCKHPQILRTHFPESTLEPRASRDSLRLKLWTSGPGGVASLSSSGEVTWYACPQNDDGSKAGPCSKVGDQPADSRVTARIDGGQWRLQGGLDATVGSHTHTILRVKHNGTTVSVAQGDGAGLPITYGMFELDYTGLRGGRLFATEIINGANDHPDLSPIDTYLLGLAEVPYGWHPEALRTQAVAARSYAEAVTRNRSSWSEDDRISTLDCRCDLRVDTGDQVWAGARYAGLGSYPNWEQAVAATAGTYLVKSGSVVTAFYSSSHGGWSRRGFSSQDPNYGSVDVSRWEKASGNPRYRWSQGFSVAELERAFGFDDIDGIRVTGNDAGGYPLGLEITGVDGGEETTRVLNDPYQQVRNPLGLYSPRFAVHVVTDLADDDQIPVGRLAGDTRVETAIRLSADGWSDGADTVVIARDDSPADALTGSSLAGTHDAPLLLTPQDHLAEDVALELQRLEPDQVLLLGGGAALSTRVADDIRALGVPKVSRVQGETRFGTAVDVATRVSRGEETTAYLVRLRDREVEARGWVDALSVAAVAARRAGEGAGWPILGTEAELPSETRDAIAELGITRVVPVGGQVTIPQTVLDQLAALGVEVADRLAGGDRYGTSRAVTSTDTPTAESLVVATGENFPDGLAAGPYAARTGAGMLLVPTVLDTEHSPWLPDQHPAFVTGFGWTDPELFAVGGSVAIQDPVIARVADLLEAARPAD